MAKMTLRETIITRIKSDLEDARGKLAEAVADHERANDPHAEDRALDAVRKFRAEVDELWAELSRWSK